jgi:hypothetical protein
MMSVEDSRIEVLPVQPYPGVEAKVAFEAIIRHMEQRHHQLFIDSGETPSHSWGVALGYQVEWHEELHARQSDQDIDHRHQK